MTINKSHLMEILDNFFRNPVRFKDIEKENLRGLGIRSSKPLFYNLTQEQSCIIFFDPLVMGEVSFSSLNPNIRENHQETLILSFRKMYIQQATYQYTKRKSFFSLEREKFEDRSYYVSWINNQDKMHHGLVASDSLVYPVYEDLYSIINELPDEFLDLHCDRKIDFEE